MLDQPDFQDVATTQSELREQVKHVIATEEIWDNYDGFTNALLDIIFSERRKAVESFAEKVRLAEREPKNEYDTEYCQGWDQAKYKLDDRITEALKELE